jgi:hypothetical protein
MNDVRQISDISILARVSDPIKYAKGNGKIVTLTRDLFQRTIVKRYFRYGISVL